MTAIRRLAASFAADAAGYSRLMGADEEGSLERLNRPQLEGGPLWRRCHDRPIVHLTSRECDAGLAR
jgi:hypothetical protein